MIIFPNFLPFSLSLSLLKFEKLLNSRVMVGSTIPFPSIHFLVLIKMLKCHEKVKPVNKDTEN